MFNKWLLIGAAVMPLGMAHADVAVRQSGVSVETDCLNIKVDGLSIGAGDCRPRRVYRETVRVYEDHDHHRHPSHWQRKNKWKHDKHWKNGQGHWKKREKVIYQEEWRYEDRGGRHHH
ncbi:MULTISPECIES: hypothetical protein [Vibrio]|uniref:DUF2502 domain-containing protein n=1 Tax=Vibrio ostreae TaxID=2841925 RepID=A0A975UDD2_9VIBR|nr:MULTISPECIES: hypothetical protein [Vibrio]QXO18389.1 hypothetical protein KNV97_08975 [Vibrio ostreae]WGY47318.1 hypothetical protein J0X00_06465 [Vibrio sp. ABG19]